MTHEHQPTQHLRSVLDTSARCGHPRGGKLLSRSVREIPVLNRGSMWAPIRQLGLCSCLTFIVACDDPVVSSVDKPDAGESGEGEGEAEGEGERGEGEGDGDGEGEGEGEVLEPGQDLTQPNPTPQPADAPSSITERSIADHECEGDEDFCEPTADLGLPDYDILASWSHVAEGEFIIQVLYRGVPFLCSGQLAVVIDVAGVVGANDVRVCANGQIGDACHLSEISLGVGTWEQNFGDGDTGIVYYPPPELTVVFRGVVEPTFQPIFGFLPDGVRFGRNGHLVELHVPMEIVSTDGSAPFYALDVNYAGDATNGDEGVVDLVSVGGAADNTTAARVPVVAVPGGIAACLP